MTPNFSINDCIHSFPKEKGLFSVARNDHGKRLDENRKRKELEPSALLAVNVDVWVINYYKLAMQN